MSDEPIFQSSMPPEGMGGGNLKDLGAAQAGKNPAPPKKKVIKLTPKQELFCHEYLKDTNATKAAIRAGYSENCAAEIGYENLRKPHISDKVMDLIAERCHVIAMDASEVIKLIHREVMTAEKSSDRLKALDMLMRATGGYQLDNEQKDNEIKVNVNIVRDDGN